MQERLEQLTKSVEDLNLEFVEGNYEEKNSDKNSECVLVSDGLTEDKLVEGVSNHPEKQMVDEELPTFKEGVNDDNIVPINPETDRKIIKEPGSTNAEDSDPYGDAFVTNKQSEDRRLPNAILPLLRYCQYESSESSCRYMTLWLSTAFSQYLYDLNI